MTQDPDSEEGNMLVLMSKEIKRFTKQEILKRSSLVRKQIESLWKHLCRMLKKTQYQENR
jgi:transposase